MVRLSKDIIDKILSVSDIDTRRLFARYSQIKVPADLATKLSQCFSRLEFEDEYGSSRVQLNAYELVFRWYEWPPTDINEQKFEVRFEPEGRSHLFFNLNQRDNHWWADGNFTWPLIE